ncbi:hypothetical protein TNCV_2932701 [Trichonephila clavipes]|nr:hypothetical protein TNCV_2932701 [Trichonephila clavipes]
MHDQDLSNNQVTRRATCYRSLYAMLTWLCGWLHSNNASGSKKTNFKSSSPHFNLYNLVPLQKQRSDSPFSLNCTECSMETRQNIVDVAKLTSFLVTMLAAIFGDLVTR